MGEHEPVPPEIARTLVGWKKHFNSYTTQGRFNVRILIKLECFYTKEFLL